MRGRQLSDFNKGDKVKCVNPYVLACRSHKHNIYVVDEIGQSNRKMLVVVPFGEERQTKYAMSNGEYDFIKSKNNDFRNPCKHYVFTY